VWSAEEKIAAIQQLDDGRSASEVAQELGVSETTLYNWKAKHNSVLKNGAKSSQKPAGQSNSKDLEDENRRLKRILMNLLLENDALKEAKNG
jgi:putative transposase